MLKRKQSKTDFKINAGYLADKAALKIAEFFVRVQYGFAKFMNRKTKRYSTRTWKVLITVFAVGWGSLSMYFIINACIKHPVTYKSHYIQFIVKPARNDSLAIIEQIYEQEKKKQQSKK